MCLSGLNLSNIPRLRMACSQINAKRLIISITDNTLFRKHHISEKVFNAQKGIGF